MSADEYRQVLKRYPAAAAQYAIYCKQHNRKMLEELHDSDSRTYHLGITHLEQASSNPEISEKLSSLDSASKSFKMNGNNEFAVRIIDAQRMLLERQRELSEKYPDKQWISHPLKVNSSNILKKFTE